MALSRARSLGRGARSKKQEAGMGRRGRRGRREKEGEE